MAEAAAASASAAAAAAPPRHSAAPATHVAPPAMSGARTCANTVRTGIWQTHSCVTYVLPYTTLTGLLDCTGFRQAEQQSGRLGWMKSMSEFCSVYRRAFQPVW